MKKILPWLFLITFSILTGLALFVAIEESTESVSYPVEFLLPKKKTVTLVLVGDIMLDRGVEAMIKNKGEEDYKFPFLKIADYLNKADIVFGNLESPISDKGVRVGSIYSFRAEPKTIEGLTFAGFDVLSVANNHAFDYGREALEDTLLRLKKAGIDCVGTGSPVIKEINGSTGSPLKVAFLAYTNLGSPAWGISWADQNNIEEIKTEIKDIKSKADILIVSLHAGEEYQKTPAQFQVEFFKIAREAGADVVFGHHPHVVQPDFYSLGNFIFDQGFSKETMKGLLLEVVIRNKKIQEVKQKEVKINGEFQPTLSP